MVDGEVKIYVSIIKNPGIEVFNHKGDKLVLERLELIQASCLTIFRKLTTPNSVDNIIKLGDGTFLAAAQLGLVNFLKLT